MRKGAVEMEIMHIISPQLPPRCLGNASFYSTVLTGYLQCTYLESTG